MVTQVRSFPCTVPAGTPIAAPATFQLQLGVFEVATLEVHVPPGPNGLVGFYIASSHNPVLPAPNGGPVWLVANDRVYAWTLTGQPDSGDWQLVAYNLGNFPHTLTVTWGLSLTGGGTTASLPDPISDAALTG